MSKQGGYSSGKGGGSVATASELVERLRRQRPKNRRELANYLKVFLGIDVPSKRICDGHKSPLDYLAYSFFADFPELKGGFKKEAVRNGDCVVWSNRGGGKTLLAAAGTLLDCVFKGGCSVQILGGSLEQSTKMYEYFKGFVYNGYEDMLALPMTKQRCEFVNSSWVKVLTQSEKSVRGSHVNKLRCDEIEEFDRGVFEASKFVSKSDGQICSAMEVISTMHRPWGLMQEVVGRASNDGVAVFKWCMWEVIEKCVGRSCSRCGLNSWCGGKAKRAAGYLKIDDCISQLKRSSRRGFESEMLCVRPMLDNAVFSEFDVNRHVREVGYDSSLKLYRSMDFGFVNPFVCLWMQIDDDGVVRVIDEYVRSRATIAVHAEQIKNRTACDESMVGGTFCDPAGAGRNDVTGTSAVRELRELGMSVRYSKSRILEGIELVRRAICNGAGESRLVISPRCGRLIEAMECYHYPENEAGSGGELPLKDGVYDHPIDALRYFFVGLGRSKKARHVCY